MSPTVADIRFECGCSRCLTVFEAVDPRSVLCAPCSEYAGLFLLKVLGAFAVANGAIIAAALVFVR
jgi:hypothetical protein